VPEGCWDAGRLSVVPVSPPISLTWTVCCKPNQLADFRNVLALAKLYIRTTQLRDDLIYRMLFLTHLKKSVPGLRPDRILSLQLDQF